VNVLEFATLVITGFVACAEFGSYAFVHPVIRRLPPTAHLQVEQGLLRTFGRVMPVGMTLCVVLAISSASSGDGGSQLWRWLAVAAFVLALVSTVVFNVPINLATGKWDAESPHPTGNRPATGGSSSRASDPGSCSSASSWSASAPPLGNERLSTDGDRWLLVLAAVPLSRPSTATAPNQRAVAGRTMLKRCSGVGGCR